MNIISKRKILLTISTTVLAVSIISFALWGLDAGIDFTGGSLLEITFTETPPTTNEVSKILTESKLLDSVGIQLTAERGMILRFNPITESTHQEIIKKLNESFNNQVTEIKFDSIGPVIGQELKSKTLWAIVISLIGMIIYIAAAFVKISKPVPSWQYGIIATIALFHNIMITVGIFSFLGRFYQVEINAPFIAALLTILGYSINDTIVIFDRIRENLVKYYEGNFEETVQKSINESMARSLNTGFCTLLTLFAVLAFGGETIRDFILALIIGIIAGTYSSIFLASPLLVIAQKLFKPKET